MLAFILARHHEFHHSVDRFIRKDRLPTWNQDYTSSSINSSLHMLDKCIGEVCFLFQFAKEKYYYRKMLRNNSNSICTL